MCNRAFATALDAETGQTTIPPEVPPQPPGVKDPLGPVQPPMPTENPVPVSEPPKVTPPIAA